MNSAMKKRSTVALKVVTPEPVKSYTDMPDEELIVTYRKGDQKSFEYLMRRYKNTIAAVIYKCAPSWMDPSDMQQEVQIRVWKSLNQLREPACFKAWLQRVIKNVINDQARAMVKQKNCVSIDSTDDFEGNERAPMEIPDSNYEPESMALNQELLENLKNAVNDIPELFRTPMLLRTVYDMSYEEIADVAKLELGTVKSRISRARRKVEKRLSSYLKDAA